MNPFVTKTSMIFFLSVAILACGGGSGEGSADDEISPEITVDEELESDQLISGESDQPIPENDGSTESSNVSDSNSVANNEGTSSEPAETEPADSDGADSSVTDTEPNQSGTAVSIPSITTLTGVIDRVPFLPSVAINRFGYVTIADDTPSGGLEQRLFKGTQLSQELILSEGDSVANIPRLVMDEIKQIAVAQDGSVAAIIMLRGQGGGPALIVSDGEGLRVLTYSDERLVTINTNPLLVSSINHVWRAIDQTLFLVTLESGNRVLLLQSADGVTALVESSTNAEVLTGTSIPTIFDESCRIRLDEIRLEPHVFTEQGSILFTAEYGQDCLYESGVVRYQNGRFQSVVAEGAIAPGTTASIFGVPEIVRLAADGSSVIQVTVSRDETVFQEGNTGIIGRDRAESLWQYSPEGDADLMVVQGESIQTPEGQFFLDDGDVDRRTLIWNGFGHFALALSDDEKFLLTGATRAGNPYPNFDSVGASSLSYSFSTLTPTPDTYPRSAYYDEVIPHVLLPDGRILFDARINDLLSGGRIYYERYLSQEVDEVNPIDLQPIYDAGHGIDRNDEMLIMENGDIVQHGSLTSGGGYYFMTMRPSL